MIGSVATSWRATAFAQALDEHELDEATPDQRTDGEGVRAVSPKPVRPPAPRHPSATGAHRSTGAESSPPGGDDTDPVPLLDVTDRLKALPKPALAPDVKTVQRALLIAAMEAEFASGEARAGKVPEQRDNKGRKGAHRAPALSPLSKLRPRSRLSKGLAAGGLGVGVAASALGGVAAASGDALPGDTLYGFKRGMEDLQLNLAGDDADRGQVHLDHASTRMKEARRLMERTRGGSELDHESLAEVRKALSGMRQDATEGHRLLSAAYERDGSIAPMRSLSSFSSNHRDGWSQLRHRLPVQLTDVGDEVSSVFDAMDSDVGPLARLISGSSADPSHQRGQGGERRTGEGRTSPQPSASSGSGESEASKGQGSGSPSPSGSGPEAGELIGGTGLFDPPESPSGQSSGPGSGENGEAPPHSEVTLPPIVPDVLPGLRNLSEDYKKQ